MSNPLYRKRKELRRPKTCNLKAFYPIPDPGSALIQPISSLLISTDPPLYRLTVATTLQFASLPPGEILECEWTPPITFPPSSHLPNQQTTVIVLRSEAAQTQTLTKIKHAGNVIAIVYWTIPPPTS